MAQTHALLISPAPFGAFHEINLNMHKYASWSSSYKQMFITQDDAANNWVECWNITLSENDSYNESVETLSSWYLLEMNIQGVNPRTRRAIEAIFYTQADIYNDKTDPTTFNNWYHKCMEGGWRSVCLQFDGKSTKYDRVMEQQGLNIVMTFDR